MQQKWDELKGKDILVTGGAGFIGSHLVDKLSLENRVVVIDNLSTGLESNLAKSKDRITFLKGDIRDKALVKDVVGRVEYIFHLAAHVGNVKSIADPYLDMEVNVKGMINLLDACQNSKIKRLVDSSSGAIFGEAKYLPIDEAHPLNPESPYGVSKLAAEKYCFAFHKVHGVPVTALRYFNVYGTRQGSSEYANVIAIFFNRIREGKPLTIYGDGKQTRDFVFVGDVVRANILAATQPNAVGEVFNIATGKETTIEELANVIKGMGSKETPVIHAAARAGEVRFSRATIEKAQRVLGYNPEVSLPDGLSRVWQEEMR